MKQLQQCEYFDVNVVSQRINIQRPYFAFERLWQDGKSLVGDFAAEQPTSFEAGPVASGVLGSCTAVVLHDGPEAYYLATKAQFTRKYVNPSSSHDVYSASAQVMNMDKRTLNISAQAWGNEEIAELKCEYVILSPSLFKRSFKHYANEYCPSSIESPYQHSIPLHGLDFHGSGLNANAGPLSPAQCAGHFSFYPCWPVAIIAQTGSQVTGEFLREIYGKDVRFHVRSTKLSAEKLVGADTVLKFCIEIIEDNFPVLGTVTRVYRDDEEVAQLINVLEIAASTS
jgi:hypothetical protein